MKLNFEPTNCSEYAIKAWIGEFGSYPVKEVASANWSECYEMDAAHVFQLENGKYAYVRESGCSCYDYSDAYIVILDSEEDAMTKFNEALK